VLAEQAAQNAAEVEEAYGGSFAQRASNSSLFPFTRPSFIISSLHGSVDVVESDQEWTGIAVPEREREYSDEEQLATVTVVEDFDPSSILLHGATTTTTTTTTSDDHNAELLPAAERRPLLPPPEKAGRSRKDREGLGKKAVRYETKAARRATQAKQRARRTEKAERAGGKAARKRAGGKKPRTRK
jgi:ribosomal RNA-processing protein 17